MRSGVPHSKAAGRVPAALPCVEPGVAWQRMLPSPTIRKHTHYLSNKKELRPPAASRRLVTREVEGFKAPRSCDELFY